MNRDEAIRRLREEVHPIEAGQKFEIRRMEPEDAWGVARCFFSVYGEHYPFDTYYLPAKLIEENRRGKVFSVVARTESGDIIGYEALYRSSAHFSGVYELGQALVLPEYRHTFAALCLHDFLMEQPDALGEVCEIFGEAVCNHLITQKMMTLSDFRETGLELGLMPAEAYRELEYPDDRVSTVLGFKTVRDRTLDLHVPEEYARALEFLLSGLDLARNLIPSAGKCRRGSATDLLPQFIDYAQVARFNLYRIGEDFPARLLDLERQAQGRGIQVIQVFVNLGEPCSGWAVRLLRQAGYFFGGLLPRWFDTDGLLMVKLRVLPHFASIKLASARAKTILEFIREDLEQNPACRPLLATCVDDRWRGEKS